MNKNYIITIGIGKYENQAINPLAPACQNDCEGIKKALADYGFESLKYPFFRSKNSTAGSPLEEKEAHLINEEATLDNIKKLFENLTRHPEFKRVDNCPANNLIIYYSGHGLTGKRFNTKSYYHWVPYDYAKGISENDEPDQFTLFGFDRDLITYLGLIRFKHLIIIMDSCFSSEGLSKADLFPPDRSIKGYDPKEEGSVWAFCSAATNKKAYADEEHSLFTANFIELLKTNNSDRITLTSLVEQMEGFKNLADQRPFFDKLNLIENNTGKFIFESTETRQNKNASSAIIRTLEKGLSYINFSSEKDRLKQTEPFNTMVIFSQDKGSALPLMMRSSTIDANFPGYPDPWDIIDENAINHIEDVMDKILSFFQLSMKTKATNEEKLLKEIAIKVSNQSYFIGLHLHENTKATGNVELVKELMRIVNASLALSQNENRLCLFILDELATDYNGLQLVANNNLQSILFPDPILVKSFNVHEWYGMQMNLVENDQRKGYVQSFIRDRVYKKISAGFQDDRPANVIRRICKEAECTELADILLMQTENKRVNYPLNE